MLFLAEIEMKFCRNFANVLQNMQIWWRLHKKCEILGKFGEISEIERRIQSKHHNSHMKNAISRRNRDEILSEFRIFISTVFIGFHFHIQLFSYQIPSSERAPKYANSLRNPIAENLRNFRKFWWNFRNWSTNSIEKFNISFASLLNEEKASAEAHRTKRSSPAARAGRAT